MNIDETNSLTLATLRQANRARLPLFKNAKGLPAHPTLDGSDWKLTEWVNATAGELGELADMVLLAAMVKGLGNVGNTAKKVERGDVTLAEVREKMGKEMADVLTYLDILAFRAGIDLGAVTIAKFNEVSRRVDCAVRIYNGSTWGMGT